MARVDRLVLASFLLFYLLFFFFLYEIAGSASLHSRPSQECREISFLIPFYSLDVTKRVVPETGVFWEILYCITILDGSFAFYSSRIASCILPLTWLHLRCSGHNERKQYLQSYLGITQ